MLSANVYIPVYILDLLQKYGEYLLVEVVEVVGSGLVFCCFPPPAPQSPGWGQNLEVGSGLVFCLILGIGDAAHPAVVEPEMLRDLGKTIGPRAPGGPDGLVPAHRFGLVLGKWRGGPCEAPIRGRGAENNKKQDLTLNA